MSVIPRRGILFVLSSPSGAGKTTICRALQKLEPTLAPSISITTRPMRPGEVEGVDYNFLSREEFNQWVQEDKFLEHAEVFGHGYGTPRQKTLDMLNQGHDVIFDIDWQGTQQLAQMARTDLVSVFILPPSLATLEERLHARAQDTVEVVEQRMKEAANEMSHWAEYDYVIVNRNLDESVASVRSILWAERRRRTRQLGLTDFVNRLRKVHEQLDES